MNSLVNSVCLVDLPHNFLEFSELLCLFQELGSLIVEDSHEQNHLDDAEYNGHSEHNSPVASGREICVLEMASCFVLDAGFGITWNGKS